MKYTRDKTRRVMIGDTAIGAGAPVAVQSMTTADTMDISALSAQMRALAERGCELIRVALYSRACAAMVPQILEASPVPVIGDVHFDADIAVAAIENGIHKVRINPGNIGSPSAVRRVADAAKAHGVPIRVGANGGSLPKDLDGMYVKEAGAALANAALGEIRALEKFGFEQIVVSVKSSSVPAGVEAARIIADTVPYPLHLGVTEAGTFEHAVIKSAAGIGALLLEGIGDTIRVSVSGDPLPEVDAARRILEVCGLRKPAVEVISCPTCSRCGLDVESAAREIEAFASDFRFPVTVAVMGCAVNGPGEARRADAGIAGAPGGAILFEHGKTIGTVREKSEAVLELKEALLRDQRRKARLVCAETSKQTSEACDSSANSDKANVTCANGGG